MLQEVKEAKEAKEVEEAEEAQEAKGADNVKGDFARWLVEAAGVGIFKRIDNTQLNENAKRPKRSKPQNEP